MENNTIAVADNNTINVELDMFNRHGLIAGATGTGKTITLRKFVEIMSSYSIPVFVVDIKGDLSGIINAGENKGKVKERIDQFNLGEKYLKGFPVRFWDIFGKKGIPIRLKISDFGPLLLSRLLELNSTQEGVLNLVFKVADDNQIDLVSIEDLRKMLTYLSDNYQKYQVKYGNISKSSIGAIARQLLVFENQGGTTFFGKPSLDINDFFKNDGSRGIINILNAEELVNSPKLFSSFLLWVLVQFYSVLPEVGDKSLPKFGLFFDEAHLIFSESNDTLLKKIEQVVRLIRSKGVGVYFITQNPLDLPASILGQLGNRIQHALRAFTPKDKKNLKAVAETFRDNENLDEEKIINELGVGEALISFLDKEGAPKVVQRAIILPPSSSLNVLDNDAQTSFFKNDTLYSKYKDSLIDESITKKIESLKDSDSIASENEKVKDIDSNLGKKEQVEKKDPNLIDGFVTGVLGNRKKSNAGLGYDLSNNIGKKVSRSLQKTITNFIVSLIKKKK